MKPPPDTYDRRWYDRIGRMTLALHVSRQLPRELQQVIARHLNQAIDECRAARSVARTAMSLGHDRTLGLYRAHARRRWYDGAPAVHRAFTLMSTLPDRFLADFASRVVEAGQYVDVQKRYGQYVGGPQWTSLVERLLRQENTWLREDAPPPIRELQVGAPPPVSRVAHRATGWPRRSI